MSRVLIVDDDATIRRAVSELLMDEGYVVDVASDGAQACVLAMLRPQPSCWI